MILVTTKNRPHCHEISTAQTVPNNPDAKKILLVEDNAVNSLLARSVLEKGGHKVHMAPNGAIGVDMVRSEVLSGQPFQLVYMDLHMPVLDGMTAIAKIRDFEQQNKLENVPIVILTAEEQEQTRDETRAAGADGFLTKPLDPKALLHDAGSR